MGDAAVKAVVALLVMLGGGTGVVLVDGGRRVPERDLLRGYAFAACVEAGYKGTAFAKDAGRVAELYRETGHTSRQAVYTALDRAAAAVDPSRPALVDGANLTLMSCLEFYEGRKLSAAIDAAGGPPRAGTR